jgi:hypothetical protein
MSSFVGFLPMNYEARSHPIRYVRERLGTAKIHPFKPFVKIFNISFHQNLQNAPFATGAHFGFLSFR